MELNKDSVSQPELTPEQELNIRRKLAQSSSIDLLFYAARANPNNPFNKHNNSYNAGMGRHIIGRKERAYHKRRKAELKAKSR